MERFLQLLHTVRAPCGIDPCGYGSTMTHWLDVEILDHPSYCLLQFDISKFVGIWNLMIVHNIVVHVLL